MPAFLKPLLLRLKRALKNSTRPTSFAATADSLADFTRTRTDLPVESALLRHQLVVLSRQVKQLELANIDRLTLILLVRCTRFWEQALVIVQPQTLLR